MVITGLHPGEPQRAKASLGARRRSQPKLHETQMNGEPEVLILRDPRESPKKCSLTPLRGLPGVHFVEYSADRRVDAGGRVLLHTEGELIGPADAGRGLFLIDCSWRRVASLMRVIDGETVRRRLPPLQTAYPRRSTTFEDPREGLASVEALYAALALMGSKRPELLAAYRWADEFLRLNGTSFPGTEAP